MKLQPKTGKGRAILTIDWFISGYVSAWDYDNCELNMIVLVQEYLDFQDTNPDSANWLAFISSELAKECGIVDYEQVPGKMHGIMQPVINRRKYRDRD